MDQQNIPYLCGGIFFSLLLEARKIRSKVKDRLNEGTDGLSEIDVMIGLIETVTGEKYPQYSGQVIKKETSNFKTCKDYGDSYIPFKKDGFIISFNSAVNNRDQELLKRMSNFISQYLSKMNAEWLVRALLETIMKDEEILPTTEFTVSLSTSITKEKMKSVVEVELPVFLLSVFRFIINERKDNTKGSDTFYKWFKQSSTHTPWKLDSNIGSEISWSINVRTDCPIPENGARLSSKRRNHPGYLELPEIDPHTDIPYSPEDQALLKAFNSDYDVIMKALISENYAESLCDMTLPNKINMLYSAKWKLRANDFNDPNLKANVFGLLGELNSISDDSGAFSLRRSLEKIRNLYVKLHPDLFDLNNHYDAFIDDWNDGEF